MRGATNETCSLQLQPITKERELKAALTRKKLGGHTVCLYSHAAEFVVVEAGRRVVGMLDELLRRWHDQPEALVGAVRRHEIPVAQAEESVTTAQRQLGEEARLLAARPQLVLTEGAGRI